MSDLSDGGIAGVVIAGVFLCLICSPIMYLYSCPSRFLRRITLLGRKKEHIQAKRLTVDGIDWFYLDYGASPETAKHTIFLVHGFNANSEGVTPMAAAINGIHKNKKKFVATLKTLGVPDINDDELINSLESNGIRMISPDLPAHGQTVVEGRPILSKSEGKYDESDLQLPLSTDFMIDKCAAFIRAPELKISTAPGHRLHIYGTSMGGLLAGTMCAKYKNWFDACILACAAGVPGPTKSALILDLESQGLDLESGPPLAEAFAAKTGKRFWLLPYDFATMKELFSHLFYKAPPIPSPIMKVLSNGNNLRRPLGLKICEEIIRPSTNRLHDDAPNIECKSVLLMHGDHDDVIHVSSMDVLKAQIDKGAREQGRDMKTTAYTLQKKGHVVQMEAAWDMMCLIVHHLITTNDSNAASPSQVVPVLDDEVVNNKTMKKDDDQKIRDNSATSSSFFICDVTYNIYIECD